MSQRTKWSPDEKIVLIQKYLSGDVSYSEAVRLATVNETTFRDWVRLYRQEGSLGLLSTGKNRNYSPELKINAVEAYLSGKGSIRSVSEKFKIRSCRQLSERYYGRRFTDCETLVKMIEDYIEYYNTKRLQRNLGILTPFMKNKLYLAA